MKNLHGIIYAYLSAPALGELVSRRTSSSLPFCSRYRLIDFALSSMVNAGAGGVGVIMQRDYQSLLDHIKNGRDWNLDKRNGGLRILPPFGMPDSHLGEYKGNMEALAAVRSYVESIREDNVVLMRGDVVANIDFSAALETHLRAGAGLTAVVGGDHPADKHHRFIPDGDGYASEFLVNRYGSAAGVPSIEVYFIAKTLLVELIDACAAAGRLQFHNDALFLHISRGGKVALYYHEGYVKKVTNVGSYYEASMDMLKGQVRAQVFDPERPVRTKERAEASTYYAETAKVKNSLVADGCIIEGTVEDCVIFRGVRIKKGAKLKNCIIMQDSAICENADLSYVISDKNASVSACSTLSGSPRLPLVIPKGVKI